MSAGQLRPLSFGELLDGAFTLFRRHFATFALVGVVSELPVIAVHVANAAGLATFHGRPALMRAVMLASAVGYLPSRPALVWMAARAYRGEPLALRGAAAATFRRFGPFLVATLLTWTALAAGGIVLLLPAVPVALLFFAAVPVVMIEGGSPAKALARSARLANPAGVRVFGAWAVLYAVVWIAMFAAAETAGSLGQVLAPARLHLARSASMVAGALVGGIVQPLQVIGMTLLYYDLRVRAEALDLASMPAPVEPALA